MTAYVTAPHLTATGKAHRIPLGQGASDALCAWMILHRDEISTLLAPFDLTASDVLLPEFERLCTEECGKAVSATELF